MNAPTAYEALMTEKYLKESIIAQAKAVHCKEHSIENNWDVVISSSRGFSNGISYTAHVIVYTKSGNGWMSLEQIIGSAHKKEIALKALLSQLEMKVIYALND